MPSSFGSATQSLRDARSLSRIGLRLLLPVLGDASIGEIGFTSLLSGVVLGRLGHTARDARRPHLGRPARLGPLRSAEGPVLVAHADDAVAGRRALDVLLLLRDGFADLLLAHAAATFFLLDVRAL